MAEIAQPEIAEAATGKREPTNAPSVGASTVIEPAQDARAKREENETRVSRSRSRKVDIKQTPTPVWAVSTEAAVIKVTVAALVPSTARTCRKSGAQIWEMLEFRSG
jgi:hypothetical protein